MKDVDRKMQHSCTSHRQQVRNPKDKNKTLQQLRFTLKVLLFQLWDIRRKGCIFTYKGHKLTVNSLKFSPDGQWIASAGEEGLVKVSLRCS